MRNLTAGRAKTMNSYKRIDWMNVGKNHTEGNEGKLIPIFLAMDWQKVTPGFEMAMMPGLGIQAAIKELRIPKVSHVATSPELAPYGLYGIRGRFTGGGRDETVDLFIVDEGCSMHPLAAIVYDTITKGTQ